MSRNVVRKSVAVASLVVGLALIAPPPAAALPWVDTALLQVAKVTQVIGSWLGTITQNSRIGDETASLDPDGRN